MQQVQACWVVDLTICSLQYSVELCHFLVKDKAEWQVSERKAEAHKSNSPGDNDYRGYKG